MKAPWINMHQLSQVSSPGKGVGLGSQAPGKRGLDVTLPSVCARSLTGVSPTNILDGLSPPFLLLPLGGGAPATCL